MRKITHDDALAWIEEYRQALATYRSEKVKSDNWANARAAYLVCARQEYRIEQLKNNYDNQIEDDAFRLFERDGGEIENALSRLQGAVEFAMWMDSDPDD